MSISEKQLLANQANARKSTGPRTTRGKARSSQNATTHGLRAVRPVVNSPHLDESPEEYDALLSALRDELQPHGAFQNHLVVKIANCLWRAQRAVELETTHLDNYYQDADHAAATFPAFFRLVTGDDYTSTRPRKTPVPTLNRDILYYEMRLDRQLTRSYALLRHLQAMDQLDSHPCGPPFMVGSSEPHPPDESPETDDSREPTPIQRPPSPTISQPNHHQSDQFLTNEPISSQTPVPQHEKPP